MTFDMRSKLQAADFRAIWVLVIAGISVSVAWSLNATLVYDDIAFPENFSSLVNEAGWFNTLIKIFCLDLPNEYRTYGLSRVTQFLIWSLGGATVPVYSALISIAHLATVGAIYALLVSIRRDRIIALAMSMIWLFSPFIWTSCYHHYSYLILPAQIVIIGSYFLLIGGDDGSNRLPVIGAGVAIGLTGELHLLAAPFVLFSIALASGSRAALRTCLLIVMSMILAIVAHYLIWKFFAADNTHQHRFAPSFTHDPSYWSYRFFVAGRGIGRSILEQLSAISDHHVTWLAVLTLGLSVIVFSSMTWVARKQGGGVFERNISTLPSLKLSGILFVASCAYFAIFILVVVVSDSVPQTMPRRYGYIPLTLLTSSACFAFASLTTRRLNQILILSFLIGAMGALFIIHQAIVIPETRSADDTLSDIILDAIHDNPESPVLFFSASEKFFPRTSIDAATLGPAMRDITASEVTQAKYGTYWPAYINITKVLGAPYTCELGSISKDKILTLVCPPWQSNPGVLDGSKALILANLGFSEYDPLARDVRIFRSYDEFEPYAFSRSVVRDIDWAGIPAGDVLAIDMGFISPQTAANDVLPDKHFNAPAVGTSKSWMVNYGLMVGDDNIYRFPSVSVNSEYYRTNRNGNFEYSFRFLESDVTVDLDFWELWQKKPGERIFDVQVSWNDGKWVSLGNIDPALINGDRPFAIRLSRQNAQSFSFRLSGVPEARDLPFIQGVRITRRASMNVTR